MDGDGIHQFGDVEACRSVRVGIGFVSVNILKEVGRVNGKR